MVGTQLFWIYSLDHHLTETNVHVGVCYVTICYVHNLFCVIIIIIIILLIFYCFLEEKKSTIYPSTIPLWCSTFSFLHLKNIVKPTWNNQACHSIQAHMFGEEAMNWIAFKLQHLSSNISRKTHHYPKKLYLHQRWWICKNRTF